MLSLASSVHETIRFAHRVSVPLVRKQRPGTDEDRTAIATVALAGIVAERDLDEIAVDLDTYRDIEFPFVAATLVDLAADVLELADASREHPLSFHNLNEWFLPDHELRGNTAFQKHRVAIQAVVMTYAGIVPDYWADAGWWQTQNLEWFALRALKITLGVTAERTGQPVNELCHTIANRPTSASELAL